MFSCLWFDAILGTESQGPALAWPVPGARSRNGFISTPGMHFAGPSAECAGPLPRDSRVEAPIRRRGRIVPSWPQFRFAEVDPIEPIPQSNCEGWSTAVVTCTGGCVMTVRVKRIRAGGPAQPASPSGPGRILAVRSPSVRAGCPEYCAGSAWLVPGEAAGRSGFWSRRTCRSCAIRGRSAEPGSGHRDSRPGAGRRGHRPGGGGSSPRPGGDRHRPARGDGRELRVRRTISAGIVSTPGWSTTRSMRRIRPESCSRSRGARGASSRVCSAA
jgi:hypothetical protein